MWQKTFELKFFKMVLKLFSCNKSNIFRFISNGIIKRNNCTIAIDVPKDLKYLLVLDFEATCEKGKKVLQEIIEFPCLKINYHTLEEEARFHYYVRPTVEPVLSDFCIQLTGILQEVVDEAPIFTEVYYLFDEWRKKENLTTNNSLYVTSGDWDLGHMMKAQCLLSSLKKPHHMNIWADLKKVFANYNHKYLGSFIEIMSYYGLEFEGRPHSGINDCLNMLRVIKKMKEQGIEFKPTSKVLIESLKVLNISHPASEFQMTIK